MCRHAVAIRCMQIMPSAVALVLPNFGRVPTRVRAEQVEAWRKLTPPQRDPELFPGSFTTRRELLTAEPSGRGIEPAARFGGFSWRRGEQRTGDSPHRWPRPASSSNTSSTGALVPSTGDEFNTSDHQAHTGATRPSALIVPSHASWLPHLLLGDWAVRTAHTLKPTVSVPGMAVVSKRSCVSSSSC